LAPAAEYPIIRECHVGSGSGNALDEVREPLAFKYEGPMRAGAAPRASCRPRRIRANFDTFAADRFIIGSESQVVDLIGRYGERTGTDHMLLRVQWPGLDQKTVVRHAGNGWARVVEEAESSGRPTGRPSEYTAKRVLSRVWRTYGSL